MEQTWRRPRAQAADTSVITPLLAWLQAGRVPAPWKCAEGVADRHGLMSGRVVMWLCQGAGEQPGQGGEHRPVGPTSGLGRPDEHSAGRPHRSALSVRITRLTCDVVGLGQVLTQALVNV